MSDQQSITDPVFAAAGAVPGAESGYLPDATQYPVGRLLAGDAEEVERARRRFFAQPLDMFVPNNGPYPFPMHRTTLRGTTSVSGPGTFRGSERSTLTFGPAPDPGWWIDRADMADQFPIAVDVRNVWTTARNIVLRAGSPHNYLRMVEHIVAFRAGLALDDVQVSVASGDPPLFDRGNLDIYEAIEKVGVAETDTPATFMTVREPVTFGGARGDFLTFLPAAPGQLGLRVDCAIDWKSVIGSQRVVFDVTPASFRIGAEARTNAPLKEYFYARTVGKLFAETRNLGYTKSNILIHGRRRYLNEPRLLWRGRSLEPVWHRATLDLLAAVSLMGPHRFAGTIVSFRAGHTQDVKMCSRLVLHRHLVPHS